MVENWFYLVGTSLMWIFGFQDDLLVLDDLISGKRKRRNLENAKHQGRSVCSVRAERVSDDATYLVKFICIKSAAEIQTLNFFSPKYTRNPAYLSVNLRT